LLNHIKGGLKVFTDYLVSLLLFLIFLYPFISLTGEGFTKWLPLFSLFIFFLMSLLIYVDMKALAHKEKRPQYTGMHPYPFKGIILGSIGILPIGVVILITSLITLGEFYEILKPTIIKGVLGPVYFFIPLAGNGAAGYILAGISVPVAAMLGYLAGHFDFELGVKIKELKKKLPKVDK